MAEQKIGTRKFRTMPVQARRALGLQVRLGQVLAKGSVHLPDLLGGLGQNVSAEAKAKSDAAAVRAITDMLSIDADTVVQLVSDLAECAQVERPSGEWATVDIDAEFTGHLGDIPPFLLFVIKEQFGDFIGAALANSSRKTNAAG